jgi:hypothetical protein
MTASYQDAGSELVLVKATLRKLVSHLTFADLRPSYKQIWDMISKIYRSPSSRRPKPHGIAPLPPDMRVLLQTNRRYQIDIL